MGDCGVCAVRNRPGPPLRNSPGGGEAHRTVSAVDTAVGMPLLASKSEMMLLSDVTGPLLTRSGHTARGSQQMGRAQSRAWVGGDVDHLIQTGSLSY